ncbi:MAG: hypothetical protein IPK07_10300 [Deltaproteobacteria bacterium]|nr:hypothetical protein [Deltaproteobacteria bacterium]
MALDIRTDYVPNGAGWELKLKRVVSPEHLRPGLNPLAIIPGYGMNAFIFGYHPSGESMEEFFARRGFEVWSLFLRKQRGTRRRGGTTRFGMGEVAITDLRAAFDHIHSVTATGATRIDSIGCSLGGSYQYIHASLVPDNRMGAIVSIGSPLAWHDVHPLIKRLFGNPRIVGSVPFAFSSHLAELGFPLLKRVPSILKIYLHPEITDTSKISTLVKTIEDPIPQINREIAEWIRKRDLVLSGRNITRAMQHVKNPLLVVVANADGIVPEATVLSAFEASGAERKDVLRVGTDALRFAHADLFISRHSHELVFEPIAAWLESVNAPAKKAKPAARRRGR